MGLTVFFSLSLPANVPEGDALNALNLLRSDAQRLVKTNFPKGQVGRLFRMDREEIVVAQADMNCEPFGFAVQACRPIGARGVKPMVGMGFIAKLNLDWEMSMGLCRYAEGSPIIVEWKAGGTEKYYGEWFFYNHIKPVGREDRAFVRTLLNAAKNHGFSVQVKDEAGETF